MRVSRKVPRISICCMRSNFFIARSVEGERSIAEALLTTMSIPPNRSTVSAHRALNVVLLRGRRRRRPAPGRRRLDLRRSGVDRALQPRVGLVGLGQQGDVRAVLGGATRDRQPDAAAPARHEDRPPGQRLLGGAHAAVSRRSEAIRGYGAARGVRRPPLTEVRSRRVAGDGVELAVQERGLRDAPTVLLIHGFPDTQGLWSRVAPRLAEQLPRRHLRHPWRRRVHRAGRRRRVRARSAGARRARGDRRGGPRAPRASRRSRLGRDAGLGIPLRRPDPGPGRVADLDGRRLPRPRRGGARRSACAIPRRRRARPRSVRPAARGTWRSRRCRG